MINVEVEKAQNETSPSLLRRFTKRVQESNVLTRARGIRFYERPTSKFMRRKQTLKYLARKVQFDRLVRLGRAPVKTARRGRRR